MNEIQVALENLCRCHGITSLYVFGSRAGEISARSRGEDAANAKPDSDGDFAAQFGDGRRARGLALGGVISDLEEIFDLPRADLLVLNDANPFMALEAVRGELIFCLDLDVQAEEELRILRIAGDLAPFQRQRFEQILEGELRR